MSEAIRTLDLHGLNRYQAEIAIRAQLRRSWGLYRLRLIHGHHNGVVLRDFIRESLLPDPQILRLECLHAGCTDLVLRELEP